MENILVVTVMVGGLHIRSTDGTIDTYTKSFVETLRILSLANLPVQLKYSVEEISIIQS